MVLRIATHVGSGNEHEDTSALEHDAQRKRMPDNRQILAPLRWPQIFDRGTAAPSAALRHLIKSNALPLSTVEVFGRRPTARARRAYGTSH
jgi:hypothetical protein